MEAVLERVLEWCAEIFGVSVRSKLGQLVGYCVALFVIGLLFMSRWGPEGWLVPAALVAFSAAAARQVAVARNEVWRAAAMSLEERRQRPPRHRDARLVAPTATSLRRLAECVDDVRRGRYVEADERVESVQRDLLRPEEIQLLDAVRAMVSIGTGSTERAAQQAAGVLPSGSAEIDACLRAHPGGQRLEHARAARRHPAGLGAGGHHHRAPLSGSAPWCGSASTRIG